jgi:hypothetical protein
MFFMTKKQRPPREKFARVPEEIRRLSVLLEEEALRWPEVSARSMFGMRALYRKGVIFALLPETKMIDRPTAIGYKFADRPEARREGHQWQLFDVGSEADIAGALQILGEAHRKAGAKRA